MTQELSAPDGSRKAVKLNKCLSSFRCTGDNVATSFCEFKVAPTLRLG